MKLVADANVLLAAVLGGRANAVLQHSEIVEVFTTEVTFAELEEYAAALAKKRRLSLDTVLLAIAALPVTIVDASVYARSRSEARRRIAERDPNDVDVLALALHLRIPLWSNDRDFEKTGIERFTTAELLSRLSI